MEYAVLESSHLLTIQAESKRASVGGAAEQRGPAELLQ